MDAEKVYENESTRPHSEFVRLKKAIELLIECKAELKDRIVVTERLTDIDAIIATGSNNSRRYFEYYFSSVPGIIRSNRTSVAVLSGNESEEQLLALGDDVYRYFGLGCRNVSHIIIPQEMNITRVIDAFNSQSGRADHHKFHNNYIYHKAILLMNLDKHLDSGFSLYREIRVLHCPPSIINYHRYSEREEVSAYIRENSGSLQLVVGESGLVDGEIPFGKSQYPGLKDYADGVDSLEFLNGIKPKITAA
jgi:hypothetical protein